MKQYDFELAQRIIEKFTSITIVDEVSMGMQEDWFWTAETVWKDGEYQQNLSEITKLAGIDGSDWATPVIQIDTEDGETHVFNCYKGESDMNVLEAIEKMFFVSGGCLSGPVTASRINMDVKDLKDNLTPTNMSKQSIAGDDTGEKHRLECERLRQALQDIDDQYLIVIPGRSFVDRLEAIQKIAKAALSAKDSNNTEG